MLTSFVHVDSLFPLRREDPAVMRTVMVVLALLAISLGAGCSSYNVTSDFDAHAPFASYKTYKWSADPANAPGNLPLRNQLLGRRVKSAVDAELAARGMTLVTSRDADLIVASHLTTRDKPNITDWGYRWGAGPYYGYGPNVDVNQYTEGTLVVDMIECNTKELVWRGIATGAIPSTTSTPEELEARIKDVVGSILAKSPPKK